MKIVKNSNKFAKPRLLIIGCGDVGMRLIPLLRHRFRIFALTSQAARCAEIRAAGAIPIVANLDQRKSLDRLMHLANYVVHLAPPATDSDFDQRTRRLTAILPDNCRFVYISTSGVYGDCESEWIDETRSARPVNARARRRLDAETHLRAWAIRSHSQLSILRVPGIYAADRLPHERLRKQIPALIEQDDVYTNHIHADDLAAITALAVFRAAPNRIYHAVDDSEIKMADYFDLVARAFDLPLAPRLSRAELEQQVSAVQLSFMSESRRMKNNRIKREMGVRLIYPSVVDGVSSAVEATRLKRGSSI